MAASSDNLIRSLKTDVNYKFKQGNRCLSAILHSHRGLRLPPWGDEQHAGGPRAAGIWVGVPGLGIAVVKKHEVQLSLMNRQLEEQGRSHPSSRRLEVSLSSRTEHGPSSPAPRLCGSHKNGTLAP